MNHGVNQNPETPNIGAGSSGVPRRDLIIEFTKMEGAGNDFVVIDNRFYHFSATELSVLARVLCDRRRMIGGDGLLALDVPTESDTEFRMRYYNADGTLGSMCGNGARCMVAFARDSGIEGDSLSFGSDAGRVTSYMDAISGEIGVVLPSPRDLREDVLPTVAGLALPACYVWTGTEHAVYEVTGDLDDFPVERVGRAVRQDPLLAPAGANVNFVARGESGARVRTYEKGVEAETLACGTGAIAVAVCGAHFGWWPRGDVSVVMAGGTLRVRLPEDVEEGIGLSGPVRSPFRGSVAIAPNLLG